MEIITVRELAGMDATVARRVFVVSPPPPPNDSEQQKWYDSLVKRYGHMEEVETIELLGDDYYMVNGGMGMSGDYKLLMFRYETTGGEHE